MSDSVPPMRTVRISAKLYAKLLDHAPGNLLAEMIVPHTGAACLIEELEEIAQHFRIPWPDAQRLQRGEITLAQAAQIARNIEDAERSRLEAEMLEARKARQSTREWLASHGR